MKQKNVLPVILVLGLVFVGFSSCLAETEFKGIKVVPKKETVFANDKGMWRYTLQLSSDVEGSVTVERFISKLFTMKGDYITHHTAEEEQLKEWGFHKLYPNKAKNFRGGFPSKNDIYFEDYIFIGTDEEGNDVMGTARIHFVKAKRERGVGPFS